MSHCKSKRNDCQGLQHCHCECDDCIAADDAAGVSAMYQGYEYDDDFAEYMSHSDADPGL